MRKWGLNCKGVTILEGLIALTLLALVATGTFSVMLSTARKSSTPDIREEMVLAVDRAFNLLQAYVVSSEGSVSTLHPTLQGGLCGEDSDPLGLGTHQISCLLPPICDRNAESSFSYTIDSETKTFDIKLDDFKESPTQTLNKVTFNITCNGFTL